MPQINFLYIGNCRLPEKSQTIIGNKCFTTCSFVITDELLIRSFHDCPVVIDHGAFTGTHTTATTTLHPVDTREDISINVSFCPFQTKHFASLHFYSNWVWRRCVMTKSAQAAKCEWGSPKESNHIAILSLSQSCVIGIDEHQMWRRRQLVLRTF